VQWTNYLSARGEMIGMRIDRSDATTYTCYFHKDHLGSIAIITDAVGAVVQRLSYDAWGKRRFPNGQDDPSGSIASQTTRGFTGHERRSAALHIRLLASGTLLFQLSDLPDMCGEYAAALLTRDMARRFDCRCTGLTSTTTACRFSPHRRSTPLHYTDPEESLRFSIKVADAVMKQIKLSGWTITPLRMQKHPPADHHRPPKAT
jgi:hypothetical protein